MANSLSPAVQASSQALPTGIGSAAVQESRAKS